MSRRTDRRGGDRRLGDILLSRGLISAADLNTALEIQQRTHQKLGEILVEQGLIHTDDLDSSLNVQMMSLFSELSAGKLSDEEQETELLTLHDLFTEVATNQEKHKVVWEQRDT